MKYPLYGMELIYIHHFMRLNISYYFVDQICTILKCWFQALACTEKVFSALHKRKSAKKGWKAVNPLYDSLNLNRVY